MFTGIVREIGTVQKMGKTLEIRAHKTLKGKKIGDSVAVDGTCMTITGLKKDAFETEIMEETAKMTTLGSFKKSRKVNLEPSATLNDSLDGHFVSGHVDTTGEVVKFEKDALRVKFPEKFGRYMAWKGPITINGVNLTITDLAENALEVKLIPHTIKNTNLGSLKKGDKVNIEVDILARYIERLIDRKEKQATYEFLRERNLI